MLRQPVFSGILAATLRLIPADLIGQAPLAFEVVGIRRKAMEEERRASLPAGVIPGPAQSGVMPGGRLVAIGITLRELIRDANCYQRRPPSDVSRGRFVNRTQSIRTTR